MIFFYFFLHLSLLSAAENHAEEMTYITQQTIADSELSSDENDERIAICSTDPIPKQTVINDFLENFYAKIEDVASSSIENNSCLKRGVLLAGKCFFALFGIGAGMGSFEPACLATSRFIDKNPLLCYACGTSVMIVAGTIVTWMGGRLLDRLLGGEEKSLHDDITDNKKRIVIHILANCLGALSCLPDVYTIYKYNSQKSLVIPAALISYILKTEGFYLFLYKLMDIKDKKRFFDGKERSFWAKQIDDARYALYRMTLDQEFKDEEVKKDALFKIKKILNDDTHQHDVASDGMRKGFQYANLIFPLGQEIIKVLLVNQSLSSIIRSSGIRFPLALCLSIPGFSIHASASLHSAGNIFDAIKSYSVSPPSFMAYFFPKTNYTIFTSVIVLSILAAAPGFYIAYDVGSSIDFSCAKYILSVLYVINSIILESFIIIKLYQDWFMNIVERCSTKKLKFMARMTRVFATIAQEIEHLKNQT
jgi:hypothetical protein